MAWAVEVAWKVGGGDGPSVDSQAAVRKLPGKADDGTVYRPACRRYGELSSPALMERLPAAGWRRCDDYRLDRVDRARVPGGLVFVRVELAQLVLDFVGWCTTCS